MKEILLTQGKVALVDDEDYKWLSHGNGWLINVKTHFMLIAIFSLAKSDILRKCIGK
jgi:hypothetical protein